VKSANRNATRKESVGSVMIDHAGSANNQQDQDSSECASAVRCETVEVRWDLMERSARDKLDETFSRWKDRHAALLMEELKAKGITLIARGDDLLISPGILVTPEIEQSVTFAFERLLQLLKTTSA